MHRLCELLGMYLFWVAITAPYAGLIWVADPNPMTAISFLIAAPLFLVAATAHLDANGLLDDGGDE